MQICQNPLKNDLDLNNSNSSNGFMEDPCALTLHFVTDPGKSVKTKNLIQPLVKWFDPTFRLFNVAERSKPNQFRGCFSGRDTYSALSVVLFLLHGDGETDNRIMQTREYLARKPWRFHHREATSSGVSICEPNNQDFHTMNEEVSTLWGVRQVHYGKQHLRFMLYTSRTYWHDMLRFYALLLPSGVQYQKADFCYFVAYSADTNMDVQLALKIAPEDATLRHLNSAFLQFKIQDIENISELLPNSCTPISPLRWQTTDPDGNVVLLFSERKLANKNLEQMNLNGHLNSDLKSPDTSEPDIP